MAAPIRKYEITTYKTGSDGKKYYRTVGEIAVWQGDNGERLSLEWFSQPDTDFAVFEKKPRQNPMEAPMGAEERKEAIADALDINNLPF